MHILVTGGAGYVGSVVTEGLLAAGHKVTVIDNLQQGHKEAVPPGADFVMADIADPSAVAAILSQGSVEAVMHMAAETVVEFSATDPRRYFQTNVIGGLTLLDAMLKYDVHRIIFSSSAAIYGEPQIVPIDELHPKDPVNAYGASKLMFEQILGWYGKAYGLKHISLRYFNAAGATEHLGEEHQPETHLVPRVLEAAYTNAPVSVFGADYPTRDGTCIRDYVHVSDIAAAHALALDGIDGLDGRAYNLGTELGYSVLEVIDAAQKATGNRIMTQVSRRRPGDPSVLVASSRRARLELGWEPKFCNIDSIVRSAWQWMQRNPQGYSRRN